MKKYKKREKGTKILTIIEQRTIELRYSGNRNIEVRDILLDEFPKQRDKVPSVQTISDWFYIKGRLRNQLRKYTEVENKFRVDTARQLISANVDTAVRALLKTLRHKDGKAVVASAREIINRELGDYVKKFEGKLSITDLVDQEENEEDE